ncbi:MAG: hypothetical protein ACI8PZ_005014 [Myxococcota bacterium]|jgi:hypothetical protein
MRLVLFLAALALTGSASAQTVTLGGSCPGPVSIDVTGLTPGGNLVMIASNSLGSATIPSGICAGTNTGLGAPMNWFGPVTDLDADGAVSFSPSLPGPACGLYIVAVDMSTCSVSSPPVSFSDPPAGGAFACGAFGDTLAEHIFAPSSWIVDADRIVVTPTETAVAVFDDVYIFDHDLTLVGGPVVFTPPGNKGMQYSPVSGNIYGHSAAALDATLTVWDGALSGELASYSTGQNLGAGFVDPVTGDVNLVRRTAGGMAMYDEAGTFLGDWGDGVAFVPMDAEVFDGKIYVANRSPAEVQVFDLATKALDRTFPAYDMDGIAIDDNGTVYLLERGAGSIDVFANDGTPLDSIVFGAEEPAAITFNPHTRELVVGFFNGGDGIVRNVCPRSP